MIPRRLTLSLIAAVLLAVPATAHAGLFPGEVVDGPSPDIMNLGALDVARDGTGAVAYIKRDNGIPHVFVSRLVDGGFGAPARVDVGLDATPATQATVAAADGGQLVVAFVNGGTVYVSLLPPGATAFQAPQALGPGSDPSADMAFTGAAYVTWTSAGDIRAARLDRKQTTFTVIGAPLDVDPAMAAGDTPAKVSDVAISADGTGLATWGESGSDGRTHVYARRLFGANLSNAPQDLTLSDYQGHPAGAADTPRVRIEDDSSFAWVEFRQVLDGVERVVARRLIGSAFDPPQLVDGMGFPADEPAGSPSIAMSGRGVGLLATARTSSDSVWVAPLIDDAFGKGVLRLDTGGNTIAPDPVAAFAENNDGFVTWMQSTGPGDTPQLQGRLFDNVQGLLPGGLVSNPALGPVDTSAGMDAAADRVNDVAIVAIQGTGAGRQLVADMVDRPPSASGSFVGYTPTRWRMPGQLSYAGAFDLWGPLTYTMVVDGKPVGSTHDTRFTPSPRIPDGQHHWRIVATDRRGQTLQSPVRLLRVDGTPPRLRVQVSGTRRAGTVLKFVFRASDPHGSGLARIRVVWGDGSPSEITGTRATHAFRHGRVTVRVSATDRAGNVAVVNERLNIKK